MNIEAFVDEGLGNSSYLLDLGDGRALAVDPSRDPRPYIAAARRRGLRIAYSADTHLHADFLSGSRELAAGGAEVLASAGGERAFPHRALRDADEVDLGGLTMRALATPGHTDEHISFLILDGARPLALFTGGALIVGAVARTDLGDPARTEELARAAYRSLHERILQLPDDVTVYPTHGAGSFCSSPAGAKRTSTIGQERASNALVQAPSEDAFVRLLLDSLGSYPAYFRRLAEVNRDGPSLLRPWPSLRVRSLDDVRALLDGGALGVDVRPVQQYAAGHIPGALSIALRPAFATWLGWLVEPDRDLVFILDREQDRDDLVSQALKIGYERLAGELDGGMRAWRAAGLPEARFEVRSPDDVPDRPLLDVRQASEFAAGHAHGAINVELGALARVADLPADPLTVMCEHGFRATTGASVLERAGRRNLSVVIAESPADGSATA